jgi:hypothetical protein
MLDKSHFFRERLQPSSDLAERVRARWGIVYHAVEAIHGSEIVEHGTDLLQPETPPQQPVAATPVPKREAVQAAQVGSNVFNLEAYREHRQQTAAEVEAIGQQRLAEQARLNAEAALREGEM